MSAKILKFIKSIIENERRIKEIELEAIREARKELEEAAKEAKEANDMAKCGGGKKKKGGKKGC